MRVAVLTQYFPTSRQPWAGHSAYQTIRVLAQRCDCKVFFPEAVYPPLFRPKTYVGPLDRAWQPKDIGVEYIPYPVLPAVSRPLNGFEMTRRLRSHIAEFRPDVILNYTVYPDGYAATMIAKELKVPVVLTAIGSDLNRMSDPLCGALTRSALRHADAVITVSRHLGETAVRLGAAFQHTHAIHNGCNTDLFSPKYRTTARTNLGLYENSKIVLYVGRMDVRKGLMELVDALVALKPNMPELQANLVGEGPDRSLLEQTITRHKAPDYVHIVPACPTAQVAEWMGAADLITLPSYAEGCPNVVIEALCSGRPVVASNVGGIPELMDDSSGRLVPPKDSAALHHALDAVLTQSWDAAAIAAKHKRSWSDVADDVYDVLAGAIQNNPHSNSASGAR